MVGLIEYSYPTLRLKSGIFLPCGRVVGDVVVLVESVRWRGGGVLVHGDRCWCRSVEVQVVAGADLKSLSYVLGTH